MMSKSTVRVYVDPEIFWNQTSFGLRENESENCLMLGLAQRFRAHPEDCVYQSAIFHDEQFLGAAIVSRYGEHINLVVSRITEFDCAKALYDKLQQSRVQVTGLLGEVKTVGIYESFFKEAGFNSRILMQQGIYRCRRVKMPNSPERIKFRQAEEADIPQIGEWIESFRKESLPHESAADSQALATAKVKEGLMFVLEKEQTLIAMAGWGRDIGTSASVNLVYTPKLFRKRGYGSLVTAQLTQLLLNSGKRETNLYTDLNNPTSNKIYQDIGYDFVCNSVHVGLIL